MACPNVYCPKTEKAECLLQMPHYAKQALTFVDRQEQYIRPIGLSSVGKILDKFFRQFYWPD